MKIGIITSEYSEEGGGLSFSCLQFHRLLEDLGHEVCLTYSKIQNCLIIQGGYNNRLGKDIVWEEKLKRDSEKLKACSIIIAFGGGYNGYYATLVSQKIKSRLWILFRGSDANLGKWDEKISYYNTFSVQHADQVCCPSNEMCENILLLVPNLNNISVIPNYGKKNYVQIKHLTSDNIIIGTGAAHLNEKKGIVSLLKLVHAYNQYFQGRKIRLELVGAVDKDVLEQYQNIVQQLNIQNEVTFIDCMSHQAFHSKQKEWDFYVQTSICEGMANSVVDSMSMGIPVIVSNTGFVAEFMNEHFPEAVFHDYSPESMAKSVDSLIHMKDMMQKYQYSYDLFFELISKENVIKKWEKLLGKKDFTNNPSLLNHGMISVVLHDIQGDLHDHITTPVSVFEKFVCDIAERGLGLCSIAQYMSLSTEKRCKWIACTFDDGYSGVFENALPILRKHNYTATVFVCSDYMGEPNNWNFKDKIVRKHMTEEELKQLQKEGWEIGSHGKTHQSLLRLDDLNLIEELSKSKEKLQELFGPIQSYAYPYGDYNDYIVNIVKKYYKIAFALTSGGNLIDVDSFHIRRYFISDIYQIIGRI